MNSEVTSQERSIIPIDEFFIAKRNETQQKLFALVEQNTPEAFKSPLFPQDEGGSFIFHLNKGSFGRCSSARLSPRNKSVKL